MYKTFRLLNLDKKYKMWTNEEQKIVTLNIERIHTQKKPLASNQPQSNESIQCYNSEYSRAAAVLLINIRPMTI